MGRSHKLLWWMIGWIIVVWLCLHRINWSYKLWLVYVRLDLISHNEARRGVSNNDIAIWLCGGRVCWNLVVRIRRRFDMTR